MANHGGLARLDVEHSGGARTSSSVFPSFAPIARDRALAERVADSLLEAISLNELKPGERLPSTQALSEQFEVSRTVIREAVRTLLAKDVVRADGRRLYVSTVRSSAVRDSMTLFLRGRGVVDYARIHEVRMPLEIALAGLAADRATPADIERLESVYQGLPAALAAGDIEAAAHADVAFHRTLAELTRNELFPLLLDAMGDVMLETRRASLVLPTRQASAPREHARIHEQVSARDASGARAAMREHLADSNAAWSQGAGID